MIEASSGSTAVSEAYFARMLGLPFIAVMPRTTSPEKVALIEREGGRCHLVDDAGEVYDVARRLAEERGGHYLDQFTYAERATDWRGNNNIAEWMFEQMARERHPVPRVGRRRRRHRRHQRHHRPLRPLPRAGQPGLRRRPGELGVPAAFRGDDAGVAAACGSRIEGIGRPRVEPSFVPTRGGPHDARARRGVGRRDAVPHASAPGCAAARSTGTNLYGVLRLACEMAERGERGSIVSLLCDGAERYAGDVPRRRLARRARAGTSSRTWRAAAGVGRRRLDRLTLRVCSLHWRAVRRRAQAPSQPDGNEIHARRRPRSAARDGVDDVDGRGRA